jgi:RNA polymerase sigma-70 factor (ECF subfamily)
MAALFFDRYCDRVNRLVWKLMLADADHDDVVNTAFLQMYSSIKRLNDPKALPCWVSTITINTIRKEIRKRRYYRMLMLRTETPEASTTAEDSHSRDAVNRTACIVETMTPDNRIIFILRYVEGCTFEEIATLRNCSLATVKRYGKRCKEDFMRKAAKDTVLSKFFEELNHE